METLPQRFHVRACDNPFALAAAFLSKQFVVILLAVYLAILLKELTIRIIQRHFACVAAETRAMPVKPQCLNGGAAALKLLFTLVTRGSVGVQHGGL